MASLNTFRFKKKILKSLKDQFSVGLFSQYIDSFSYIST